MERKPISSQVTSTKIRQLQIARCHNVDTVIYRLLVLEWVITIEDHSCLSLKCCVARYKARISIYRSSYLCSPLHACSSHIK